jgi:hypothetical protein
VQIDELEATIESCRKFILAGRIAVASGGVVLFAMLVGGIQFNPSVMGIAAARLYRRLARNRRKKPKRLCNRCRVPVTPLMLQVFFEFSAKAYSPGYGFACERQRFRACWNRQNSLLRGTREWLLTRRQITRAWCRWL